MARAARAAPLALLALLSSCCCSPALALRELATRHAAVHAKAPRLGPAPRAPPRGTPGVANCTLTWFTQAVDHFSFVTPPTGAATYAQRVFTYDAWWRKDASGCVFFYAGNEADVTLYVEHTGLMWENAQALGCRIVFAEHRYYGASQPFGAASALYPQYMTHEQAVADYAVLALSLAQNASLAGVPAQPVILFGGSYGGMLAAWIRYKHPATFAGAIAASAPLATFSGTTPAYDPETYWRVVTADASAAHGAAPACAANVRAAFAAIYDAAQTPAGLANLSSTFQLCAPLQSAADADQMAVTLHLNAWDTMAMGNYPYPSNYLTNGGPLLPAWPVRAACELLADPGLATGSPWALLAAFNAAGSVFNNATQNIACYAVPSDYWLDGQWDYQWCTEQIPEESYFATDGVNDMFAPRSFSPQQVSDHCFAAWGVRPRPQWMRASYGNVFDWATGGASNIVFSNGLYDPWSSGGVKANLSDALPAVILPTGAHHIDTFFSNPEDPASVTAARAFEVAKIQEWISEFYAARAQEL